MFRSQSRGSCTQSLDNPPRSPQRDRRELSELPAGEDVLVPGTAPEVLAEFTHLPSVAALVDLNGVESSAGAKLGNAFFKLMDRRPEHPGVRREVEGLDSLFTIPEKHLTPLLDSPKALESGEPELRWHLASHNPEGTGYEQRVEGLHRRCEGSWRSGRTFCQGPWQVLVGTLAENVRHCCPYEFAVSASACLAGTARGCEQQLQHSSSIRPSRRGACSGLACLRLWCARSSVRLGRGRVRGCSARAVDAVRTLACS